MPFVNKFPGAPMGPIAKAGRIARDQQILAMAHSGKSIRTIAAECNVSTDLVARRLPILLDIEAKKFSKTAARELLLQLSRLDMLFEKTLEQFEKSCQPTVAVEKLDDGYADDKKEGDKTTVGMNVGDGPKGGKVKRKVKTTHTQNVGDPRFLSEARMIMAERRKILGLDDSEVKKIIINNITGNEFNVTNVAITDGMSMTEEEMESVARIMAGLNLEITGVPKQIEAPKRDDIEGEFTEEAEATLSDDDMSLYDANFAEAN